MSNPAPVTISFIPLGNWNLQIVNIKLTKCLNMKMIFERHLSFIFLLDFQTPDPALHRSAGQGYVQASQGSERSLQCRRDQLGAAPMETSGQYDQIWRNFDTLAIR